MAANKYMRKYYAESTKYRKYKQNYNKIFQITHKLYRINLYKTIFERNRQILWSLKASNQCIDCKKYCDPRIMEFDHIIKKRHGIGSLASSGSVNSIFKELAKCQTVCANCHRLRTWKRRQFKNNDWSGC